jgi:hypothetical protein
VVVAALWCDLPESGDLWAWSKHLGGEWRESSMWGGGGFDRAAPKVFKGEANVAVGLDKLWRWDAHTTWHMPDPSGVAAVPT